MKHLLSALFLLTSLHLQAQQQWITVDGTKIWTNTIGMENRQHGQPVIVFESGYGTPMGHWDTILDGVAEFAPLMTYDRPGIGRSEPDQELPTPKNVSDKLMHLLQQLDIEPPYVLVGHSLGGVYVRGFAVHHPNLLAGLVIIDPADFTETLQNRRDYYAVLGWNDAQIDSFLAQLQQRHADRIKDVPPSLQEESQVLRDLRESGFKEITETPLPNIPVHIITGGRFDLPEKFRSKKFDEELLFRSKMKHRVARWTDVIQSVDKGMLFYSADAGHFVHRDAPELVLSSIKIVLNDYDKMRLKAEKE
ncbi:MAG: alpha/beta hydrolase [Bacteroidota bacterium]